MYSYPPPRSFAAWCHDLGVISTNNDWPDAQVMSYEEFCFLPETTLRKVTAEPLYGFWRQYGDEYGEARTVREWLDDLGWQLVEPSNADLQDVTLFLGYDEFLEWGNGKIDWEGPTYKKAKTGSSLKEWLSRIFTRG